MARGGSGSGSVLAPSSRGGGGTCDTRRCRLVFRVPLRLLLRFVRCLLRCPSFAAASGPKEAGDCLVALGLPLVPGRILPPGGGSLGPTLLPAVAATSCRSVACLFTGCRLHLPLWLQRLAICILLPILPCFCSVLRPLGCRCTQLCLLLLLQPLGVGWLRLHAVQRQPARLLRRLAPLGGRRKAHTRGLVRCGTWGGRGDAEFWCADASAARSSGLQ